MRNILAVISFMVLAAEPLLGQTIMENPTACFGRDCNKDSLVAVNKADRSTAYCFDTNSWQIQMDQSRPDCKGPHNLGYGYVSVTFGNVAIPTTSRGFNHALYSLEEIQNTVARYGAKVKVFTTWTGSYEACPATDSMLELGFGTVESLRLDCGERDSWKTPYLTFDVFSHSGRFDADWNPPGTNEHRGYFDLDLSQCKSDLILYIDTNNTCKFDIDMLQIQFQQL